jgi:hypothetical protein
VDTRDKPAHDDLTLSGAGQHRIARVTTPLVAVRAPATMYYMTVIAEARSEHRKKTVLAISSGMT